MSFIFKMDILENRNKKQYKKSVDGMFSVASCRLNGKATLSRGNSGKSYWRKSKSLINGFLHIAKKIKYKKAYTAALVIAIIIAIVFKDTPSIYGATYYWNQLSWSGGQTSNDAIHPGSQNGWSEFSSKDSFVKTVNSGNDIELDWTAGSSVQTSDTGLEDTHNGGGFNAGNHFQTKTRGAGQGAHIDLSFSGVAAISAGNSFVLAIKSDNSVWSWGENTSGQLGDKTLIDRYTPVQVVGAGGSGYLNDIEMVSAGTNHSLALKSDGTVWSWGNNDNGQLGNNLVSLKNIPVQVVGPGGIGVLSNVISVSAGEGYSLALKSDGTVWSWGKNTVGQLGDNTIVEKHYPVQVLGVGGVEFLSSVASISAGASYALAVKSDGTVVAWGKNDSGQLGNNSYADSYVPVQVLGVDGMGNLSSIISVSADGTHSLSLKSDGTVWSWGKNDKGQLGINSFIDKKTPVQVLDSTGTGFLTDIVSIATGNKFSLAVKNDGKAWSWGYDSTGQLGDNALTERSLPFQILDTGATGNLSQVSFIDGGDGYAVAFKTDSDGSVWSWGKNDKGQLGNNTVDPVRTPISTWGPANGNIPDVQSVSSGRYHTIALKTDGTVWDWGGNGNGQLGTTAGQNRLTPIQVRGPGGFGNLENIVEVAAGDYHSLARRSDGTVWAWGRGSLGELGDGTWISTRYNPVQVKDAAGTGFLTNVVAISAGEDYSVALRSDGTVWAWGKNDRGQLGDNSTNYKNLPVQVLGVGGAGFLNNVSSISAGSNFVLVAKNDGTVFSWGHNANGQLGDNTVSGKLTPIQVLNINNVSSISAGYAHSLALKTDGSVWSWGWNGNGQLGEGTNIDNSLLPLQVKNSTGTGFLSDISKIATGSNHCLVMKSDNTAFAWGLNGNGQLGNNSIVNKNLPVQVLNSNGSSGFTGVSFVEAGFANSTIIKSSDSLVWNWGINSYGELGNNRVDGTLLPVSVWGSASGNMKVGKTFYNSSGNFTSAVIDTKSIRTYTTVDYSLNTPIGTAILVDVRAGSSLTPDASWTDWISNISSGGDISSFGAKRFFQFRISISTANTDITPAFNGVTFNYYSFPSPGYMTSSPYNTSDSSNILSKIRWHENLQSGTDINFQVRTAPDNAGIPGAWTNWMGPDGTINTYFMDESGGEAMPNVVKDGSGDHWIQYRAILISDGVSSPTLQDVTVQYVVNAPPELQNVTASQDANGIVNVSYDVRDSDTDFPSNLTPGEVIINLQYCSSNCGVEGGEVWANASTVSGDVGSGISVEEVDWNSYNLSWNAKIDYPEIYNNASNFKVRVRANDSEGANNLGYGKSNGFELDTKNPTSVSFFINNNENKLHLTTPIDDSSYQMIVSNFSDFNDASYGAFSAEYNYSNLTSDPATVYVRIKDAHGNYTTATETTPEKLRNIVFYDISNNSTNEYRELVSWEVAGAFEVGAGFSKYNIWRSTDGSSYSLIDSISDRNVNYYLDQGLSNENTYYYKVSVEDIHNNIAEFSDIVSDSPDGEGGANATPPVISNVSNPPVAITTNSATITWDT
ncbi:MAG TPA: hypothetical protein DIC35_01920, partial [Candidatus Moranbacteria bacterium]|nr:hypothetical protein [Candidatus Moranbacteria bacterium]